MKRIDAVRNILNDVEDDEILISSAGMISREFCYVKDRLLNFYVQGSMGATLGIGIGLALSLPDRKITVVIGDGEALISLGTLVLLNKLQKEKKVDNLRLIILDNNQYQSTGGQKTVSDAIDFRHLCTCFVAFVGDSDVKAPRITIPHVEIKKRFMDAIKT